MPASPRHGSWHFHTLWAIPASIRITNADTSDCLVVVDAVLTRDLLERETRPPHLASVQLKYKYSDLRLALSTPPRSLPLTGYIQSEPHRAVDIDMLLRWLPATWSPVSGQWGRLDAYRNRLIEIGPAPCQDWFLAPGHRHVQIHGAPAVAVRGTLKVPLQDKYPDAGFPICFTNISICHSLGYPSWIWIC